MVKIASPSIVYSRRRVLQVAFSAGAGGVSATLVGIQTVRAADQKVVRLRFTDNPAYQAQNIIGEYMPKEYKVESIDVGARSMSAFVAMQRGLLDINLAGYTYLVSSYAEGQPIICVAGLAGGAQRVVARLPWERPGCACDGRWLAGVCRPHS